MVHINGSLSSTRETGGIQSNPGCSRHLGGDKALQGNKTKYQAVCFRLSLHKSSTQGKKLSLADGKTHHSWSSKILWCICKQSPHAWCLQTLPFSKTLVSWVMDWVSISLCLPHHSAYRTSIFEDISWNKKMTAGQLRYSASKASIWSRGST